VNDGSGLCHVFFVSRECQQGALQMVAGDGYVSVRLSVQNIGGALRGTRTW
jgi:hypothetical protein